MKARIKNQKRRLPFSDVTAIRFEGQEGWVSADDVEFEYEDTSYWATIRYKAAIAAMQSVITNNEFLLSAAGVGKKRNVSIDQVVVVAAVSIADALIKELKRGTVDEEAEGSRNKEWAMSVLDFKITNCALSVRTMGLLKSAGIDTIGELLGFSKYDLLKNVNFGKKSVGEIEDFLAGIGLKLKEE